MSDLNSFQADIVGALKAKQAERNCPACGSEDWGVLNQSLRVSVADPDGEFRLQPSYIPTAALICKNCGYVRLHSTIALGVEKRIPDPANEEATK